MVLELPVSDANERGWALWGAFCEYELDSDDGARANKFGVSFDEDDERLWLKLSS